MAFAGHFKRVGVADIPKSHYASFFDEYVQTPPRGLDDPALKAFVTYTRVRVINGGANMGSPAHTDNTYGLLTAELFMTSVDAEDVSYESLKTWIHESDLSDQVKSTFADDAFTPAQFNALKNALPDNTFAHWLGGAQIYALVVLCKRAQVSQEWVQRRISLLVTELGAANDFYPSNYITSFLYKHYCDLRHDWGALFRSMLADSQSTIVQKNVILQARLGGLTAYSTIRDAMQEYQDFPWATMQDIFPAERTEYNTLNTKVEADPYYGFGDEIRMHGSTKYPHHFYVAKTLLIEFQGNLSMRNYAGNPNMTKREICDELLRHYRKVHKLGVSASIGTAISAMAQKVTQYQEVINQTAENRRILEDA